VEPEGQLAARRAKCQGLKSGRVGTPDELVTTRIGSNRSHTKLRQSSLADIAIDRTQLVIRERLRLAHARPQGRSCEAPQAARHPVAA
jgi:hypothetical protein